MVAEQVVWLVTAVALGLAIWQWLRLQRPSQPPVETYGSRRGNCEDRAAAAGPGVFVDHRRER